ncbi:Appr-1-p processing protein [Streptomyces sp. NPDC093111]|uniref:macro domain-containing protein n=1 Tax=Streptomyces sp. NPDC093111 TaxID=3154978 RepID=UPI003415CB1E
MSPQNRPSEPEGRSAPDGPGLPSHATLAGELAALRRPGLAALRGLRPQALGRVALATGHTTAETDGATGVEALLEAAVRRLARPRQEADETPSVSELADDRTVDPLARAAAHTFGLLPGRRGAPAQERRKAAAAVYGVTPERFRRGQEQQVIAELASAALALARDAASGGPRSGAGGDGAGQRRATPDPVPDPPRRAGGPGPAPAAPHRVTVHLSALELLRDIDILVSSENTHMEMSKTFRPTVSGALRRAAAVRNEVGEITDDVLARELGAWMRSHGRTGLPVRPGTVAPTSAGALAGRGVRRVYHAAVVRPVDDGGGYRTDPETLVHAVAAVFALAEAERDAYDPPLRSLCFPLLGSGQGGLTPVKAARWLSWAVQEELSRHPGWAVHFVTRDPELAPLLTGASSAP